MASTVVSGSATRAVISLGRTCRSGKNRSFGQQRSSLIVKAKSDSYQKVESPVRPSIKEEMQTDFDKTLMSDEANPDKQVLGTEVGLTDAMRFKGAAPEVINSRAAMIGITTAIYNWVTTGKNIYQQWQEWPGIVLATFTIITFASLVPIVRGQPRYRFGPFEPNAEIIIGRLAMFGIVCALWTPFVYGYRLWPVS